MLHPKPNEVVETPRRTWRLFHRRPCWVPTWRGWLVVLLIIALFTLVGMRTVHGFLAVNTPLETPVLVAEGWMPDSAAVQVASEFKRGNYSLLYVTGGPMERGEPLSEYKTYAELGAAIVIKLGLSTNSVQAVPAPEVRKDRTYASAIALKQWLTAHGGLPRTVNVASVGPHSRRSRLLFQRAFGKQTRVGIIALKDPTYDPHRWWHSSVGVRKVVDEAVAYVYARVLFRPESG